MNSHKLYFVLVYIFHYHNIYIDAQRIPSGNSLLAMFKLIYNSIINYDMFGLNNYIT